MIKIITGEDTIIPIDDIKKFNPNHFPAYVKDICQSNKDVCIFTYSAMMIELFEVLAPYFEVEIEFYLNCKKYGLLPYENNNLYDVYEYLSKPFDLINVYRLKVEYGQRASDECKCCNGGC